MMPGGTSSFDWTLFNPVAIFNFSYFHSKANRFEIIRCQSPVYDIRDMLFGREVYLLGRFNLFTFFMQIRHIDKVL